MPLTVLPPLDARIPQWDLEHLIPRLCPFCGTDNRSALLRPDQLPVAFCNTCGCWYVERHPSGQNIRKLYDRYYSAHRPKGPADKNASLMLVHAREASKADWRLLALSKALGGLAGKRVLDVGCGMGGFSLMMKTMGADVVGCDLSPEACQFVSSELEITVHQSELLSCASTIGNVDAVVMRDFIEHPIEPLGDIRTAISMLKPGGLLLLHTPNGGEAGTDTRTAEQWVGFRVDLEHLQYLSPHTVNWISRAFGMRIERLDTFGFPNLKGLDELPKLSARSVRRAGATLRRIPGGRIMINILRAAKAEITGVRRDPLLGSYHLFCLLRSV